MNPHRSQLESAVRAAAVHSPTVFSWLGKRSPRLDARIVRELTPNTARNYLLYHLQARLYESFYCTGGPTPIVEERPTSRPAGNPIFVQALSEANSGQGYWQDGWEVSAPVSTEKRITVRRGGIELLALPEDCRLTGGSDGETGAGLPTSLRFPGELPTVSPGFYMAVGDRDLADADAGITVRLYWNVAPVGAVTLMRALTRGLNEASLPFRFKAVNDPDLYWRCDAAVLYIRRQDFPAVSRLLAETYSDIESHLLAAVPTFTRILAPGIGLAEDPGGGDSFGMRRCRLLAEGLIRAHEAGLTTLPARIDAVSSCFEEAGIDLDRPHLSPGSDDDYEVSLKPARTGAMRLGSNAPDPRSTNSERYLAAAVTIAERLVETALWHGDICNWIGAAPASTTNGVRRAVHSTLGTDLYTGTSGLALLLAEIHAHTGDERVRHTALGAIRHALARSSATAAPVRLSLYNGCMGVALAAARVGTLTGEPSLLRSALSLVEEIAIENENGRHAGHEPDVLAGSAGAIMAALALHSVTADPILMRFATRLGDELVRAARTHRKYAGNSWRSVGFRTYGDLTGYSHGASGIACALLDLWRATGEPAYRHVAEQAFEYERARFDPEAANWPDLRDPSSPGPSGRRTYSYTSYWCHGAAGIALARIRVHELTGSDTLLREAEVGLARTAATLEADLLSGHPGISFCHGVTGNADILREGSLTAGVALPTGAARLIDTTAQKLAARYSASAPSHKDEPARHDEQLSLMLGLAGAGYFLLRMSGRTVPIILLVRPEEWQTPTPEQRQERPAAIPAAPVAH